MSATDELRRLLDERGVEYATDDNNASNDTMWTTQNGGWAFDCDYMEPLDAKPGTIGAKTELMIYGYTPEQAIAATLGEQRDTADIDELLDEFEHECFMIRVEASETRAKDGVVREAYKRQREETAQAIAATLGSESVDYMLNTIGKLEEENERLRSSCGTLTAEQVRDALMSADRWGKPMGNTGLTNTHVVIRDDGWQAIADELNAEISGTCKLEIVKDYKQGITITAWGTLCSECGAFYEFIDGRSWNCCPNCGRAANELPSL